MEKLVEIRTLPEWRLEIKFADGTHGVVSVKERLFGPMFEPLRDPDFFSQVRIDEFGAVSWPNGADLAPDALYQTLTGQARVA